MSEKKKTNKLIKKIKFAQKKETILFTGSKRMVNHAKMATKLHKSIFKTDSFMGVAPFFL